MFLKFGGPRVKDWLACFFSDNISSDKLPYRFKKANILDLLKSKKPDEDAPAIDIIIPQEQAGLRPSRNCTCQVLALSNFIEDGFQRKFKTAVTFVGFTAAYDTVWKKALIFKLMKVIPCLKIANLISSIISDRLINVHLNDKISNTKELNNGLPKCICSNVF